jgi:hypothetical protein
MDDESSIKEIINFYEFHFIFSIIIKSIFIISKGLRASMKGLRASLVVGNHYQSFKSKFNCLGMPSFLSLKHTF